MRIALRKIALSLRHVAGEGIHVERVEMLFNGTRFSGDTTQVEVFDAASGTLRRTLVGCVADGCRVGLSF